MAERYTGLYPKDLQKKAREVVKGFDGEGTVSDLVAAMQREFPCEPNEHGLAFIHGDKGVRVAWESDFQQSKEGVRRVVQVGDVQMYRPRKMEVIVNEDGRFMSHGPGTSVFGHTLSSLNTERVKWDLLK